jgi:peptide/nickel transport system substrate-binding protein
MQKKLLALFGVVMALAMVLAACEPAAVPAPETIIETVIETVVETVEVEVPVEVPVEVEVPTTPEVVPSTRTGGWFDTIIVIEEPSTDAAITRLEVEEIDIFVYTVSNPEAAAKVEAAPNIDSYRSSGSYNELSFNTTGPVWEDGRLNPFAVPAIREYMNQLIDREYITQEIMGGLGTPRWTTFNSASNDAATFAPQIRAIELKYAYNKELAAELIGAEMEALGATLEGGVWTYEGEPVEISILIRIEDERLAIGDYVGNQLEDIGFQVFRDYKSAADASPIWYGGDPNDGGFHVYTGGWITTVIPRDLADNFAFFYTDMGLPSPLWQNYDNDPAFYEVADRLNNADYGSLEERGELISTALTLAMEDSSRLWLADRNAITPKLTNISAAADLYGNVGGGWLWALTIQRAGEEGGSLTVAMPSILTEPWNPIAGSNWIYDMTLIRATSEMAYYPDPFTGLWLPNRMDRAEVVVQEGLPVFVTLDWVALSFEPEIVVPEDAWADWDAEAQQFITVGEKLAADIEAAEAAAAEAEEGEEVEIPSSVTALRKSTVYYQEDLFDVVYWHDGSPISMGDFLMTMILTFDRAKPESAIYDAAAVPAFNSFMSSFKGVKVISTDPLVIETYSDFYQGDAENSVTTWWPYYAQGTGAWHNLYLGILADAAGEAVFSQAKQTELDVDRLSFIAGPTVEIMKNQLDLWTEEGGMPYEPIFSQFVAEEEMALRIENLTEWHRRYGHFWIGTGPYYLQRAFPVEGTVILNTNPMFPDLASRWNRFANAPIPVVEVDGSARVTVGDEEVYEVMVTFQGQPYSLADITSVSFLVVDATNQIAYVGDAVGVEDGLFEIVLTSEITGALATGSNTLEVVVVSNLVAVPVSDALTFVTVE